nr:hypothetical protein [Salinisphaera sp. LB1]
MAGLDRHFGVAGIEAGQPRHQPVLNERRWRTDRQRLAVIVSDLCHSRCQPLKMNLDPFGQGAPGGAQLHPMRPALEY